MISVIIPAKDAAETIEECLQATLAQENLADDYEIIVVDDGSADSTAEIAERLGVRVIRQENAGPAAARNAGAHAARGEILAFTDADCAPSPDWLYQITRPFHDPEIVGAKGTYLTRQRSIVARFVQQEYGFKYLHMSRQESIDFIDTYSAAYRRDVFFENEGFEAALPMAEDIEFSFRLARKGYRLVFVPEAVVYHWHGATIWKYVRRKLLFGYWRSFMLRWHPEKIFHDSHTTGTLRWQILFLASGFIFLPLVFLWSHAGWLLLLTFLLFFISTFPLLRNTWRSDRAVLWVAPPMLLLRAGALGFGLAYGLLFPARVKPRTYTGLATMERFLKRIMDILGALICLLLFSPALIAAAIAIKLDSKGKVFFSQERVGENGKCFRLHKLRTMVDGAEEHLEELMDTNPLNGPVYKIPDDPRITKVGRFLRRWSLDEIPQFWNVLRGEMSLVGPRPEQTWMFERYNDRHRQRLAVKPGISGPMQISGRAELDMDDRLALEIDYINNYSIWKDIVILLCTVPAVISGDGAS